MKKLLSILLSVIMLLGLMSINVFAEESIKVKLVNYHDKDGNFIAEKYIDFDVAPSIIDGRTMVPIRAVAEELGYYVCYDNDTGAVSLIGAFESGKTNQGDCVGYLSTALNCGEMLFDADEPCMDNLPNFAVNIAIGTIDELHDCSLCNHYMLALKFPTRVLTDEEREKHSERNDWWLGDNYLWADQTALDIKVSFLDDIRVMDALTPDCANYSFEDLGSCEIIYNYNADVLPVVINGRTLLPLRAIAESMGLGVSWDETTNTVTLNALTPYFDSEIDCVYENDVFNIQIGDVIYDTVRADLFINVKGPNGVIAKHSKFFEIDESGIYHVPFEIGTYAVGDLIEVTTNYDRAELDLSIENGDKVLLVDSIYYTIDWDYIWDYETNRLKLVPFGHEDNKAVWSITEDSDE